MLEALDADDTIVADPSLPFALADDECATDALQDLAPVIGDAWDGPLDVSSEPPVVDASSDLTVEPVLTADDAVGDAVAEDESVLEAAAPVCVDLAPAVMVEDESPMLEVASPVADANFGNDEAMAPVSGYRLFGDIEPIILQDDAEAVVARGAVRIPCRRRCAACCGIVAPRASGGRRRAVGLAPHLPRCHARGSGRQRRSRRILLGP